MLQHVFVYCEYCYLQSGEIEQSPVGVSALLTESLTTDSMDGSRQRRDVSQTKDGANSNYVTLVCINSLHSTMHLIPWNIIIKTGDITGHF